MNNNLHNMNMVKTYLENANDQLAKTLAKLGNFVSIDNDALYGNQVDAMEDRLIDQIVVVKNNIIPKIEEME